MEKMTEDQTAGVEWGRPSIDGALCSRCGRCARVCPSVCIRMEDGKPIVGPGGVFGCLACGHCVAVCPESAIRVTGRGMTGADVLPLPPPSARATADGVEGLLLARRSARRYEDRPVEQPRIERLL